MGDAFGGDGGADLGGDDQDREVCSVEGGAGRVGQVAREVADHCLAGAAARFDDRGDGVRFRAPALAVAGENGQAAVFGGSA
ncbi:MAG TPA: hypothetical protein VNO31_07890, partial [Umezawaea sp.]|nr:hypothetical protein [Umezawaea sp.]